MKIFITSVQLTNSEPSIKELFEDFLAEIKGFSYQITLKVMVRKYKDKKNREFAPVSFNSTAKTVIGFQASLDRSSVWIDFLDRSSRNFQ